MSDEDISIDEKRVYGDTTGSVELAVATGRGVATVAVSGDKFGGFSLAHQCSARDLAVTAKAVAVATDEDVCCLSESSVDGTDFGPSVAVGYTKESGLIAAGPDGRIASHDGHEWTTIGSVGDVRAIDGDLLAAGDGVYRIDGDDETLVHVGLDDVRDVATTGTPLAATGGGLYYLGNGWMDALDGSFDVVTNTSQRAHAVTTDTDTVYERVEGEWYQHEVPVDEPITDLAYDDGTYAVTQDGTVLVDCGDGWRTRSLGIEATVAVVVRPDQ